jgi:hypothetical protein
VTVGAVVRLSAIKSFSFWGAGSAPCVQLLGLCLFPGVLPPPFPRDSLRSGPFRVFFFRTANAEERRAESGERTAYHASAALDSME